MLAFETLFSILCTPDYINRLFKTSSRNDNNTIICPIQAPYDRDKGDWVRQVLPLFTNCISVQLVSYSIFIPKSLTIIIEHTLTGKCL